MEKKQLSGCQMLLGVPKKSPKHYENFQRIPKFFGIPLYIQQKVKKPEALNGL